MPKKAAMRNLHQHPIH